MKRIAFVTAVLLLLCGVLLGAADNSPEADLQAALERAASGVNLLSGCQWSEIGCFYGKNGKGYYEGTHYRRIELIPVNGGESYRLVNTRAMPEVLGLVWWYDKDQQAISECIEAEAAMKIEGATDFTAPEEACYIGLSYASGGGEGYLQCLTEFRQTTGLSAAEPPASSAAREEAAASIPQDGRVIVTLGDSIFGMVDGEDGIANLLAKKLGCTVINCAFGGTKAVRRSVDDGYDDFDFSALVDAIVSKDYSAQDAAIAEHSREKLQDRLERLKTVDFGKADVVTLNYGTNDWTGWFSLKQYIDVYTESIGKLMAAYPQLQVVLITPAYRVFYNEDGTFRDDGDTHTANDGSTLADIVEGAKQVAKNLHIPCIDAYSFGINRNNYSYYFSGKDGVHHNANGRALMAEKIAQALR